MINPRLANRDQTISAYEIQFTAGAQSGKNCILVHNGELEVLLSKDNALDILYVKYNGKNISFLSRNGINTKTDGFAERFEGGFLYTCGLDNMGGCVEGKLKHGSLHVTKADDVSIIYEDDVVIISGTAKLTSLSGMNTLIKRRFSISENCISISDTVINQAFTDHSHCILYHVNYGHPFLSENLKLEIPSETIIPVDDFAAEGIKDCLKISEPIDAIPERCYYHFVKEGKVNLLNPDLKINVNMEYDLNVLPVLVEWKMMASGAYALGIEPTNTRFDQFKPTLLKKGESKDYNLKITFSKIQGK